VLGKRLRSNLKVQPFTWAYAQWNGLALNHCFVTYNT
jgi:hypothetical protein